jgi:hypothetical protein
VRAYLTTITPSRTPGVAASLNGLRPKAPPSRTTFMRLAAQPIDPRRCAALCRSLREVRRVKHPGSNSSFRPERTSRMGSTRASRNPHGWTPSASSFSYRLSREGSMAGVGVAGRASRRKIAPPLGVS